VQYNLIEHKYMKDSSSIIVLSW